MKIIIPGQIKGGKNNICITRSGHRYPNKEWAAWRDIAVYEVKRQIPKGFKPITTPTDMSLVYIAGDKRRRDMPAIVDSIFHVLEKAGIVADDTLLWITNSTRLYDKHDPMAELEI